MEEQLAINGGSPAKSTLPKRKRSVKLVQSTPLVIRETEMASKSENEDLNLHVSLCEQRYQQLEGRLDALEQRLNLLATEIAAVKTQMQQGLHEIRLLIEQQNNARTTQIVATIGAIGVAVIGTLAYIK